MHITPCLHNNLPCLSILMHLLPTLWKDDGRRKETTLMFKSVCTSIYMLRAT